jgi:hypothetical protein
VIGEGPDMNDDLAVEMAALAERLAASDPSGALDFSLESLDALQATIAGRPVSDDTTRMWGAYLGETIRRARPAEVGWVDHATAAAQSPAIAGLEAGPDLSAILQVATAFWFPLAKIEKLQRNGPQDSLRPFAAIALAPVTPEAPHAPAIEGARAREDAAVMAAASAFLSAPSGDTLDSFSRHLSTTVHRSAHGDALRRIGLQVEHLTPFLGEAARDGGGSRIDAGRVAGDLVVRLVVTGVAPRAETIAGLRARLGDDAKVVRGNAARALAYLDLCDGHGDVAVELAAHRDGAVAAGAWQAIRRSAGDLRMGHASPRMPPLVPTFLAALSPEGPHLAVAIDSLSDWAFHWERCAELVPLVPALIALLDTPAATDPLEELVARYLWAVVHGRAPAHPAIETLHERDRWRGSEPLARLRAAAPPAAEPASAAIERLLGVLREAGGVDATPVVDDDVLDDATVCSPTYGELLRRHGAVRMVRAGDGFRIHIHAAVAEVERLGEELLLVAEVDGAPVYFLRDDLDDDDEMQVVTVEDDELVALGTFDGWLAATLASMVPAG